jgi:enamine deaminase RidA (YjgF/YER057c/UK114 family)
MLQSIINQGFETKSFRPPAGEAEHYIAITAPNDLDLEEQIAHVEARYDDALKSLGLTPETAVFRRIFLSDIMNQGSTVRNSRLASEDDDVNPVAVSLVQQPPLSGAKIALLAYHLASPGETKKKHISRRHLLVKRNGRRHLWSTRLCAGDYKPSPSSDEQTQKIFDNLTDTLSDLGGNLASHCVRTWIYLRNVDVFYQGMVDRRRHLFAKEGLTGETHYIASTGIEGACSHRFDVVLMDAYSVLDLDPAQVSYLNDFDKLCATKDYNVTFERGTRVAYADRAHHFISGTASIDNEGNVVHVGDVLKQLDRAVLNVEALLRSGGGRLDDLLHLIVYLRDPTDYARVRARLREHFPELPAIIVQGAVCRPEWLIEIEGIAVAPHDDKRLPAF